MARLRQFMFEAVYHNPLAKGGGVKAQDMIARLFEFYQQNPDDLPPDYQDIRAREGVDRAVCDYIAGMTDNYAVARQRGVYSPGLVGEMRKTERRGPRWPFHRHLRMSWWREAILLTWSPTM